MICWSLFLNTDKQVAADDDEGDYDNVRGAEDADSDVEQGRNSVQVTQVAVTFDSSGPADVEKQEQAAHETSNSTTTATAPEKNIKNGKVKQKSSDSGSNKGKIFSFGQKKGKKSGPKTAAGQYMFFGCFLIFVFLHIVITLGGCI